MARYKRDKADSADKVLGLEMVASQELSGHKLADWDLMGQAVDDILRSYPLEERILGQQQDFAQAGELDFACTPVEAIGNSALEHTAAVAKLESGVGRSFEVSKQVLGGQYSLGSERADVVELPVDSLAEKVGIG